MHNTYFARNVPTVSGDTQKTTDRQTMHDTYFDRNVPTVSGDTQKTTDKQCMTLTLIEMSSLSVVIHRKQ